jgi:hypothetical protein
MVGCAVSVNGNRVREAGSRGDISILQRSKAALAAGTEAALVSVQPDDISCLLPSLSRLSTCMDGGR